MPFSFLNFYTQANISPPLHALELKDVLSILVKSQMEVREGVIGFLASKNSCVVRGIGVDAIDNLGAHFETYSPFVATNLYPHFIMGQ